MKFEDFNFTLDFIEPVRKMIEIARTRFPEVAWSINVIFWQDGSFGLSLTNGNGNFDNEFYYSQEDKSLHYFQTKRKNLDILYEELVDIDTGKPVDAKEKEEHLISLCLHVFNGLYPPNKEIYKKENMLVCQPCKDLSSKYNMDVIPFITTIESAAMKMWDFNKWEWGEMNPRIKKKKYTKPIWEYD